jgi:hypothetical protein
MSRRLPWAIWVVIVVLGAVITPSAMNDGVLIFTSYLLFVLAFATVGALVSVRRPRNPIGWLFLLAGLSYVIGGLSVTAADHGSPGAWHTLASWLGAWIWIAGVGPVGTFGLLLFPTGRLASRRWRPVAWLAGAGLAALLVGLATAPGATEDARVDNPIGLTAAPWLPDLLQAAGGIALVLALVGSVASLVARYRAGRPDERQQLKWLVYAASLVLLGVVVSLPVEAIGTDAAVNVSNAISTATVATVPIAMGIAILRHRLYDVDLVIRRTLVYAVLTATLAATYLALVLLVGLAVGRSGFAVAVSTLAVAALFRPALARIQAVVDRRFYRRRYDAARTLEAFGSRLREELDLEALGTDLRGVVRDTVQPAHVTLWLRSGR